MACWESFTIASPGNAQKVQMCGICKLLWCNCSYHGAIQLSMWKRRWKQGAGREGHLSVYCRHISLPTDKKLRARHFPGDSASLWPITVPRLQLIYRNINFKRIEDPISMECKASLLFLPIVSPPCTGNYQPLSTLSFLHFVDTSFCSYFLLWCLHFPSKSHQTIWP